jgi:hypothetical protein
MMLSRVSLLRTTSWTASRAFSNTRPVLGEQYDVVVVGESQVAGGFHCSG